MTDQDTGQVHSPRTKFGKVPEAMMHNPSITDGAIRLYAHMHWRYGTNQQNFEGRESMAAFLGVSKATITKRAAELEANDWIVVQPRPGRKSNFYHVFVSQKDCLRWRDKNAVEKPEHEKAKPRKSRKGIGGRPTHGVNSSLPVDVNLSLRSDVNLSSQELDTKEPDSGNKLPESFTNVQDSVAKLANAPSPVAPASASNVQGLAYGENNVLHAFKPGTKHPRKCTRCGSFLGSWSGLVPNPGDFKACEKKSKLKTVKPPKEPLPWSALTKAMHEATPEDIRPVTCHYAKNDVPAHALYDAGFTPERITAFVLDNYPTYREWAEQHKKPVIMSMQHVSQFIKAWEATKGKQIVPVEPIALPGASDEETQAYLERLSVKPEPAVQDNHWLSARGQLEIQLGKSTFRTWIQHLRLVALDKGPPAVYTFEAANQYQKDWLERHLVYSLTKTLAALREYEVKVEIVLAAANE